MEKSDLLKIIGKSIQDVRVSKGLSQVDLVGKMQGKIDTTNISRIESGRTNPTIYTLYRISQALEVSLEELVKHESRTI
ncbi:helix-turn-helix transcriptional regulator [Flavobacterium sp.]|uniref:helix-turn-helix domain-containing protein n=1 Tax=Flavobacterium sp. TaxID=239 RepID=UPI002C015303|nr:helix-turn-helix transcriptional regulator [Flavobacterium sp.]HSD08173.1 helix-turn-helix transcriptional regulator [Flavobacterium sp.]